MYIGRVMHEGGMSIKEDNLGREKEYKMGNI